VTGEERLARRWIDPPRLRSVEDPGADRGATWTELFFDLVFVVAVVRLSTAFLNDVTVHGFLVFAGLFIPLWLLWTGFTFYSDRFDTDDAIHRLFMLAGMFCVAAMAAAVTGVAAGTNSTAFAIAYVAARAVAIALYGRAWIHLPQARPLVNVYLAAPTFSIALWLVAFAFPTPLRYVLWAVGLLMELATPLAARRRQSAAPLDTSHLPERMGLFTIVVLGETVLSVVIGTDNVAWSVETVVAALLGFAIGAAFWWVYFDFVDTELIDHSLGGGQAYLFAHLPLLIGLATIGPGVRLALQDVSGGDAADSSRLGCLRWCGDRLLVARSRVLRDVENLARTRPVGPLRYRCLCARACARRRAAAAGGASGFPRGRPSRPGGAAHRGARPAERFTSIGFPAWPTRR